MEALQEHKVFLDVDQQENTAAYKRAKLLYASASTEMSLKLSKLFVKYDEISITIGLACLTLVRLTQNERLKKNYNNCSLV